MIFPPFLSQFKKFLNSIAKSLEELVQIQKKW